MANNFLHGALNLSRIPKELIFTNKAGEKIVYIDVTERRSPGKYGETHSVTIYDKNSKQKIYIADLKPQEFGAAPAPQAPASANSYRQPAAPAPAPAPTPAPAPANAPEGDDLPF